MNKILNIDEQTTGKGVWELHATFPEDRDCGTLDFAGGSIDDCLTVLARHMHYVSVSIMFRPFDDPARF